jgi:adenylate cyclase
MWVQLPMQYAAAVSRTPQDATQALSPFFKAVQQAVQRSGGMVERFQGNRVLAYFGAPLPLRNAPRAALEAALGIMRSRASWGRELDSADGTPAPLTIGIASGEVLSGQVVMAKASPFVMLGDAVDQAAWLAGQQPDDQSGTGVFVSASTAAAVNHQGLHPVQFGGLAAFSMSVR